MDTTVAEFLAAVAFGAGTIVAAITKKAATACIAGGLTLLALGAALGKAF